VCSATRRRTSRFKGGSSFLRIGNGNVFREHATIHRGTKPDTETVIGDRNYFMQNSHVAHNCRIADDRSSPAVRCPPATSSSATAGFVSGTASCTMFVRIGRLAMLAWPVTDEPRRAAVLHHGRPHTVRAVNLVGLRRQGFPRRRSVRSGGVKTLFQRPRNLRLALAESRAGT